MKSVAADSSRPRVLCSRCCIYTLENRNPFPSL